MSVRGSQLCMPVTLLQYVAHSAVRLQHISALVTSSIDTSQGYHCSEEYLLLPTEGCCHISVVLTTRPLSVPARISRYIGILRPLSPVFLLSTDPGVDANGTRGI